MMSQQIEMVSVEPLVPEKYTYRRLKELLDFNRIKKSEDGAGRESYFSTCP